MSVFQDFINAKPPEACGYDESTGEDKFCCKDLDVNSQHVNEPQKPLFTDKRTGEAYPCMDQTSHCERWIKINPESCNPDHKNPATGLSSYKFMREVCQESCRKKTTNFRSNKCDNVSIT